MGVGEGVLQGDAALLGQGMVQGDGGHHGPAEDGGVLQLGVGVNLRAETDVHLPLGEGLAHLAGHAGGEGEVTPWVLPHKLPAQPGDGGDHQQGDGLQPDGPHPVLEHLEVAQAAVRQGHDLLGLGQQSLSKPAQGDASSAFLEQGHSQLLLQGDDGVAQAGLRDVQPLGRPAVVHLLGEDEKVTQVINVHRITSPL